MLLWTVCVVRVVAVQKCSQWSELLVDEIDECATLQHTAPLDPKILHSFHNRSWDVRSIQM